MKTIKIAGVPEHFNLPWHLCLEEGAFKAKNIDAQWIDVPEGTGKLCQMLRSNETDIAVILTEGIIKDIAAGNDSKIVQVYVQSPLIWGIHVAAGSDYKTVSDLQEGRIAISRYGSGSHLMAIVNAKNESWDIDKLDFEVINTLEGAIEALTEGKADYFMWERFMTKPIVDKGIFRRVGDCPTPWPCFVIAVRNEVLENDNEAIGTVLDIINTATKEFKHIPDIDSILATRYNQKIEDIREWLTLTEWSQQKLGKTIFEKVQNQLSELNIITQKTTFETATK
ncbi:ABC transporter substrate-binding protein [Flavobacterium salilacus subsp. salilacus]|uniref:substrate-binding domain-containing protein n=1 Tax=Flavobacterium TaxID=237 RepID=UPI001074F1BF|nr:MULTISPECIES: substrate-binding domain-containing protein [Flavobacterium]KAF2519306.1 ABC transporter substrate-binding protein [Flavobacterium salilacus subsp. salilacus]MBE1613497.1 ABC transporter substrate-binding protein [Flavobacterium sp. SaA2.13]